MTNPNPGVRDHAPPGPERLLAGLTPEQAQAVTFGSGPVLLLAGPGAGKTRTLTHRAAYLLASGQAKPWEILAVTFSVRAASELRLRLADLLGESVARGVTAATFHSVCARLLREHASVFGRTERYTIYDQADMRRVVDWLLSDAERGEIQRALADYGQPASAEVLAEISRAKNALITPESYERSAQHPGAPLIAAVWRESERELRRCNAMDFDDLLAFAVRLLSEHPHRLAWLRARWRWIVADEFQDTSHAQAILVDLLAGPDGNLCVCGDDDQVIHTWRHADPRHILDFHHRHPARTEIVLGRNFRSRAEILEAAVRCVSPQRPPGAEGADRDARPRRPRARPRLRQRVRRGELGHRTDRRRARRRHPAGRDPRPRADRIRDRAAAARARARRHPAPRARLARPVRAHRGPRRARLPDAAPEPARRAGVPSRDRLTAARDRHRHRHQARRLGARAAPRRPDRRQRERGRARRRPRRRPRAAGRVRRRRSSRSGPSSPPAARSATS